MPVSGCAAYLAEPGFVPSSGAASRIPWQGPWRIVSLVIGSSATEGVHSARSACFQIVLGVRLLRSRPCHPFGQAANRQLMGMSRGSMLGRLRGQLGYPCVAVGACSPGPPCVQLRMADYAAGFVRSLNRACACRACLDAVGCKDECARQFCRGMCGEGAAEVGGSSHSDSCASPEAFLPESPLRPACAIDARGVALLAWESSCATVCGARFPSRLSGGKGGAYPHPPSSIFHRSAVGSAAQKPSFSQDASGCRTVCGGRASLARAAGPFDSSGSSRLGAATLPSLGTPPIVG